MCKTALIIFIVPKNSGLKKYSQQVLSRYITPNSRLIDARGEDVPFWVDLFSKKGRTIGFTGEDLFLEYKQKNESSNLAIIEVIEWCDDKALFKKPTLCLLGPKDRALNSIAKNPTILISRKYKSLADKYLKKLEENGFVFKKMYVNGCVETGCSEGIADLIIDIVYTGSSMEKFRLQIYDKIVQSNFLVVGNIKIMEGLK